jgi:hypothetical protein
MRNYRLLLDIPGIASLQNLKKTGIFRAGRLYYFVGGICNVDNQPRGFLRPLN